MTTSNNVLDEYQQTLVELFPTQGSWSEPEYLWLTDHVRRLVEFTDGQIEPLPMPTDEHQSITEFIFIALSLFITPLGGKVHMAPLRLQIRPGKFREPDVMLVISAQDPRRRNRFWTGADLTVEVVSEDKPERDLIDKRRDYAEGNVPEYWIVNPQTETITVLSLENGNYVEVSCFRRGDQATSVKLPGFAIEVAGVFDLDRPLDNQDSP